MNFFPSLPPSPPPPLPPFSATANGGMSSQTNNINANFIDDNSPSSSSSSTSVTSSIVIVSLIISSAIIISASIYILLRFLSRRSNASSNDVVLHNHAINRSTSNKYTALNSLPIFTFGSVNGNLNGGDCAICLSNFKKEDQLRLLPLCCHAFHTRCIDTWLSDNDTCPLCRSTVYPTNVDVLNKIQFLNNNEDIRRMSGGSFRVEIGSISSRSSCNDGGGRRSYSVGSFEYIVDDNVCEIIPEVLAGLEGEVGGSGRNWLREYVDRLGSVSSLRSSGRFFSGSSRRSDVVVPVDMDGDLEAINNRAGEDISELFRWISGVV